MKKTWLFLACVMSAGAQVPQNAGIVYQQAGVISTQIAPAGPISIKALPGMPGPALFGPEAITGSPFSATQQSHSLQVLGDGTRIDRTESQQIYRDSQGRTRTEAGSAGSEIITIQDPVSGVTAILDSATKTARKLPAPQLKMATAGKTAARTQKFSFSSGAAGSLVATGGEGTVTAVTAPAGEADRFYVISPGEPVSNNTGPKPTIEVLPEQNINGVLATGRRTTMTIPAGEIGNDRPIQTTSETWYSNDLQMMVKSSNSDPRFGDSSFELINTIRSEPDPSLFQIPADYTVSEPKTLPARLRE